MSAEAGGQAAVPDGTVPGAGDAAVGQSAASGVVWLTAQKWVVRAGGLVTIAVLTRSLSPDDFGVMAAATTVLPFLYLLADLGFTAYIVQAERADDRVLNTSFWFSLLAGTVLAGVLAFSAPLMGSVFGSAQVAPLLQVLSAAVVLTAAASVPTALLRRSMRFRALATQSGVAALVAQVVAVAMALTGMGVWALVGQVLVSQVVIVVLAWRAAGWRPGWAFSTAEFVQMVRFGGQVVGVEFVAMTRAWAEAAIIASTLGIGTLGYLNIAQRLVAVVQDLTGAALIPVSTVAFAKVRHSVERLQNAYVRALRLTYAVLSPPLVFLAVSAPLVIPIAFGDAWEPSFEVARILAVAGIVAAGAALDNGLFYGLGKPGRWFLYALLVDAATVAMTAYCTRWGLVGIAGGFLVVAVAATVARWFVVARLLSSPLKTVARPFGFTVLAGLISGSLGMGVQLVSLAWPPVLSVAVVGLVVGVVYLLMLILGARPVVRDVQQMLGGSRRLTRIPVLAWLAQIRSGDASRAR